MRSLEPFVLLVSKSSQLPNRIEREAAASQNSTHLPLERLIHKPV